MNVLLGRQAEIAYSNWLTMKPDTCGLFPNNGGILVFVYTEKGSFDANKVKNETEAFNFIKRNYFI
jgi:hypothetical protein